MSASLSLQVVKESYFKIKNEIKSQNLQMIKSMNEDSLFLTVLIVAFWEDSTRWQVHGIMLITESSSNEDSKYLSGKSFKN